MTDIFALIIFTLSGFFFLKLLIKKGFTLPHDARFSLDKRVHGLHFLAAIAAWVFCQIIVTSILNKLELQVILNLNFRQWFCFVDVFSNIAILATLLAIIWKCNLHVIGKKNAFLTGIFYGIAFQLPLMLAMTSIQYIVDLFGQFARGQEVCENLLDECAAFPWLYVMTFFSFAVLCPLVEELIFRGFLQNWLVNRLGAKIGIILTSILFACAHYSAEQGAANIELMTAIFVLSCIFGVLYLRTRTITASIGMHITNNIIALFLKD